jgi:hypothetical protein
VAWRQLDDDGSVADDVVLVSLDRERFARPKRA